MVHVKLNTQLHNYRPINNINDYFYLSIPHKECKRDIFIKIILIANSCFKDHSNILIIAVAITTPVFVSTPS